MTLDQMKDQIAELLRDTFKAYELPAICSELGLNVGEEKDAWNSKRVYVRSLIAEKSKKEILELLPKIKELTDCELLPEKRYSYEISTVTKRDIAKVLINGFDDSFDFVGLSTFRINWFGEIDELSFIKRICDTSTIPIVDNRFKSFDEEYYQHRVRNKDWDDSFFFTDERLPFKNAKTSELIEILCQVFHPEVRDEAGQWRRIKEYIDELIEKDGFEFYEKSYISGRPVFGIRRITFLDNNLIYVSGLKQVESVINSDYIRAEVKKAIESATTDSSLAIGQAKEIIETSCKFILHELGTDFSNLDFNKLTKLTKEKIGIAENEKNKKIPGVERVLSGLSNIASGMAELRNSYGNGHGKDPSFRKLPLRYGKLAISAASSYVEFLLDSYEDYCKRKKCHFAK